MLLKNGDKGTQVTMVQYALHILCFSPKSFDGNFGTNMEDALKRYQTAYGLSADGIVGDATWSSLCQEIKPIQRALADKGYYNYSVDGIARVSTYNAVINFQTAKGLKNDGMVGNATRNKLMMAGSEEVTESDFPLKQGAVGDKVIYLQYGLRILCCSPGAIDGKFGTGTYNAVVKFQEKYSLTADGIVGSGTWGKMKSLISEIQTALISKGYDIGNVDGVAGPGTYSGVQEFQAANGLTVDGQVGPATREKLLGTASDGGNDAFPLKLGSVGPYVQFLQQGLRIMCINPKTLAGTFDSNTESAVKRFQEKYSLTADGIVGTGTWEKLRSVIKPIQQALVNHGYSTVAVDGIAGSVTYNAVLAFQEANGLTADGMVGSGTLEKLGITTNGGGVGTISATLRSGSDGSLVRYLQHVLEALGYSVTINGIFDSATVTAVKAFQKTNELKRDGVVGSDTWSKIFEKYKVNVSGTGITKFVNVARHELSWGFKEDNSNNITPYGQWYGMQGSAWCAMFVSWCAHQAGIIGDIVPKYAYCPSGMNWYRTQKRYYSRSGGYTPKVGDVVFFWSSTANRVAHTGLVVEVGTTTITTIEGNSADGVYERTYNKTNTYIYGYGANSEIVNDTTPDEEEEAFNNALFKKGIDLLEACRAPLVYKNGKYELVGISESVSYAICEPKKYRIAPNVYVTTEINAKDKISLNDKALINLEVSNGSAITEFNLHQGVVDVVSSIAAEFDESFEGTLPHLESLEIGVQFGKIGMAMGVEDESISISYIVTGEVEIAENHTKEYSFVFKITVTKPNGAEYEAVWAEVCEKVNYAIKKVADGAEALFRGIAAIIILILKATRVASAILLAMLAAALVFA